MTVKKYYERMKRSAQRAGSSDGISSFDEVELSSTRVWSGAACEGYVRVAATRANVDQDVADAIVRGLWQIFEHLNVEGAEVIYHAFNDVPM